MNNEIKFEQSIEFLPAFDKRSDDPKTNYGINGVEMRWYLRGPDGIIQFVVYTNWQLPHVRDEQPEIQHRCLTRPLPADYGYHARVPQYEGQSAMECRLLGGQCYYDGSSLYADTIFDLLVTKGHEAVWEKMRESYMERFCKSEAAVV